MTVRLLVDLGALSADQGIIIQGDEAGDRAGTSVSFAGDVNGDGYADLIVGAYGGDDAGADAGEAYVVFGHSSGFVDIDLSSFGAGQGFVIRGGAAGDFAGLSVSSAGDVDGDGIDDLIVGAPYGDDGGTDSGQAYVVFGVTGGSSTIDLSSLGAQGFVIQGSTGDRAGFSVSSAGDVNGDGLDDLIVGAPLNDDGGTNSGKAYIIFGKASGSAPVDLANLGTQGFSIQGDAPGDRAGLSVSSAGDVNGDGFADLIVGAPYGDDGGNGAGEAYVVFGHAGPFTDIDLTSLAPAQGFVIQGDEAGDYASLGVSSAGDVNGDGFDDIVVGARLGNDGGTHAGEAYVVFGRADGLANIDLSSLALAQGFIIQGDVAYDQVGRGVASAGDVNGDGFDDLIVGAPGGDDGGSHSGEAYVIFGHAGDWYNIDLTNLAPGQGFIIRADAAGDRVGWSVSSAGDVNGDGFADLVVGAPRGDDGGTYAGEAYLIFGSADIGVDHQVGDASDDVIEGTTSGDTLEGLGGRDDLAGLAGDDRLLGGGGNDLARGGKGNDWLDGGEGADLLDGGAGADAMTGGVGDDLYYVDDPGDGVSESVGEGLDRIQATIDYVLGDNVENLTLKGTLAQTGTGNALANVLRGTAGDNTLSGRGGADELYGNDGHDTLLGDGGADRLAGGAGKDVLNGGSGGDLLVGGANKDTLTGGDGSDTFTFDDGEVGAGASSADVISDFSQADGDKLHLRQIDANSTLGGDQNFAFLGEAAFTGVAGQLRYAHAGGNTFVEGDTDGDGAADFVIRLDGLIALGAGDLVL